MSIGLRPICQHNFKNYRMLKELRANRTNLFMQLHMQLAIPTVKAKLYFNVLLIPVQLAMALP